MRSSMSIRSAFGVGVIMEQVSMVAFQVAPRVPNPRKRENRVVRHGETKQRFHFSVFFHIDLRQDLDLRECGFGPESNHLLCCAHEAARRACIARALVLRPSGADA